MNKTLHFHNLPLNRDDIFTLPENIASRIIYKSGDSKIYKDVVILTPGDWSDAITNAPVRYTSDELRASCNNWTKNYLNLDHNWTVLNRIGYVLNPRYVNNKVVADLQIFRATQNGKDTIESIEEGLINEVSVELLSTDRWDSKENVRFATDIEFIGCAIVTEGACRETRIK